MTQAAADDARPAVYDNVPGSEDIDASGLQALEGGNVTIHAAR